MRSFLFGAALLALLVPSAAADAGPGSKLPPLAKVVQLFPDVTQRQVSTGAEFEVPQDCFTPTVAGHPKRSAAGYYPGQPSPGPGGGRPDSADVLVYTFGNQHKAKKALHKVKAYVRACTGTHANATVTWVLTPLVNPGLADHSLAYSSASSALFPPGGVTLGSTAVHVVVQRDDRVIDAFFDSRSGPTTLVKVEKLAKLALRSSA